MEKEIIEFKLGSYLVGMLIEATLKDDSDLIRPIVKLGADPNGYEDKSMLRPLYYAVLYKKYHAGRELLKSDLPATVRDYCN